MDWVGFLSGRRRRNVQEAQLDVIETAPSGVWWRQVRPAGSETVHACKAEHDGHVATAHGALRYKAGVHYLVTYKGGDKAVVRADVFERTYRSLGGGRYKKRKDIVFRYFTLDRPVLVRGLEGLEHADAGDWIMEGVQGELWPIAAEKAQRKYASV